MYVFLHHFVSTLSALLQINSGANPSVHECIYTRLWNPCYHWLFSVLKKIHFFASVLAWFYTLFLGSDLVWFGSDRSPGAKFCVFFCTFLRVTDRVSQMRPLLDLLLYWSWSTSRSRECFTETIFPVVLI